ncbi:MAG: hypothetical protein ACM32O_06725 [Clostridia bacterium]
MNRTAWRIAILSAASALGGTYLFGGEWLRFFSFFGTWGTIGILLVSLAISWITSTVLLLLNRALIHSHVQLFALLFGEKAAPTMSFLFALCLLLQVGTAFNQQSLAITASLGLPYAASILLLAVATFLLVRLDGAPLLKNAGIALAAGALILIVLFFVQHHVPMPSLSYQLGTSWLWHAMFFVCLHALFLMAVFLPDQQIQEGVMDRSSILFGSIAGGFIFLVITLFGHFAILAHWHDAHSFDQPLYAIVKGLSPILIVPFLFASLLQATFLCSVIVRSIGHPLIHTHDLRSVPVHLLFLLLAVLVAFGLLMLDRFSPIAELPARLLGFAILFRLIQRTVQKSP